MPVRRRKPSTEKPGCRRPRAPRRKAEKDIFDDTDFEVDALADGDSDDKTVQLEAASDFELEEAESGSEVFAIDEDDVDQNAATAMGPGLLEEDEDDGFDDATPSGEMSSSAWDVESESDSSAADRAAAVAPILAPSAATAEWGGLWVGLLGVTTVFMLLLTFVSMDLVRNLYDFQGESPASGIVKSLAGPDRELIGDRSRRGPVRPERERVPPASVSTDSRWTGRAERSRNGWSSRLGSDGPRCSWSAWPAPGLLAGCSVRADGRDWTTATS